MARRRKQLFGPPDDLYQEETSKESKQKQEEVHLLSWTNWFFVVTVFFLAYLVVNHYDNYRPPIVPRTDYTKFSEERAREITVALSEIGPRPCGSEALELTAFNYLKDRITDILLFVREKEFHRMQADIQRTSGCFDLDFTAAFTSCYHKISNLVIRMGPINTTYSDDVFLLNCHYDTQPDAPGATDDAVSCAIMIEIMEIIARSETPLKNDIIFLFNGAEETGLQASHGFINNHPWRHSIRAFINLEGAGTGGREILFQTGPGHPWLSDLYVKNVPHPSCSILGQELFQSKIIPSDTDFRIFRDFGRIPGLDIAYFKNGWVYHTEFDEHVRIAPGDIQRTGENILALVYALDKSEYLAQPGLFEDETATVFFDILGVYAFRCRFLIASLINIVVIIWVVASLVQNRNPYFLKAIIITIILTFVPFTLILVISGRLLGFQFFWHKGIWQVYVFYFFTHVLCGLYVHYILSRDGEKMRRQKTAAFHDAFTTLLAVLLLAAVVRMFSSSFYLTLFIMAAKSKDLFQFLLSRWTWLHNDKITFYSIILSQLPLAILHFYLSDLTLSLFVPIFGRMGSKVSNPDMVMLVASHLLFSLYTWSLAPLVHLTNWKYSDDPSFWKRHRYIFFYFGVIIFLLTTTSLGTSYKFDKDMPKLRRIWATHMQRSLYSFNGSLQGEENGIVIQGLDFRKATDMPYNDEDFSRMRAVDCSHIRDDACGLPFVLPRWKIFKPQDAMLIPSPGINHPTPIQLTMTSRKFVPESETVPKLRLRIEFELTGGSNSKGLHVTPAEGYMLVNSSFTSTKEVLRSGKTYFVILGEGAEAPDVWKFSFDLLPRKKNTNMHDPTKKVNLELAVVSLYNHGPNQHSPELAALRKKIHEKRADPSSNWRWLMTLVAATAEVKVYKF